MLWQHIVPIFSATIFPKVIYGNNFKDIVYIARYFRLSSRFISATYSVYDFSKSFCRQKQGIYKTQPFLQAFTESLDMGYDETFMHKSSCNRNGENERR